MSQEEHRPARIAAFSETRIPSAALGVDSVLRDLAAHGICEFRACSSVRPDPNDLKWADSILLVRGASPAELRILHEAHRLGRLVATYMDDDLESVPPEARSGYFFTSPCVRENMRTILLESDLVLVTREPLGDKLSTRHGIQPALLRQPRPAPPQPGQVSKTGARVRIAFLGSVDHRPFLEELLGDVLRRLSRRYPDTVEFLFCGASPDFATEIGATLVPYELDFDQWRFRAASLNVDIGLAPLPVSEFHSCKYWNKYLEYGSLGIAGLYSEGSANADIVRHDETGLVLPNESATWEHALEGLIQDPERRNRIAAAAASDVEEHFSEDALRKGWIEGLAPLLGFRSRSVTAGEVRLQRSRLRHLRDRLAIYGLPRAIERSFNRFVRRR